MLEEQQAWQGSAEGAEWQRKRGALPVVQIRRGLLDALAQHDVAVVGGDTGCGKTTQVCTSALCLRLPAVHAVHHPAFRCWRDRHLSMHALPAPRSSCAEACSERLPMDTAASPAAAHLWHS